MKWAIPIVLVLVGVAVAVALYLAGQGVEATVVGGATVEGARRTIKRTLRQAEKDREVEKDKVVVLQDRAAEVAKPGSTAASDVAARAAKRRKDRGGAAVLFVALLSGCAHVPATDLWPESFPRYEPPVIAAEAPADNDCDGFTTFPLGEEEPVPECSGVLTPPTELDLLLRVEESVPLLEEALSISYDGRDRDRAESAAILRAREDQLRVARQAQLRWFAVGAGLGGGVVVAAVVAALVAAR